MDDDFWPINYLKEWEVESFINPYSEEVSHKVDEKIKVYLQEAYKKAKSILQEHEKVIRHMADVLLEKEYLSSEEFLLMVEGKELPVEDKKDVKEEKVEEEKEENK